MRTPIFAARFLDQKLGHLFVALLVSLLGPCVAGCPSQHDLHLLVLPCLGALYSGGRGYLECGFSCVGMHSMGYYSVTPSSHSDLQLIMFVGQ